MTEPYNAGQTIVVTNILKMPVSDIDFGSVTITENWGRLFIKKGDAEIVVERSAYPALCAAIQHFIAPDESDLHATKEQLAKAVEALRFYATQDVCYPRTGPVNFSGFDDNGKKARAVLDEIEKGVL